MDKITTKIVWLAHGVSTPKYATIDDGANSTRSWPTWACR
jgi:D-alanine-D-alanine ligase